MRKAALSALLVVVVVAAGQVASGPRATATPAAAANAMASRVGEPCQDPARAELLLCPDLRIARPSGM
ncbi:MAG: hypothetical protein KDB62_00460, partial [Solirubrobacterales bacterium]|nr:hypothetical protein [Solirubrobacterales bacterium]